MIPPPDKSVTRAAIAFCVGWAPGCVILAACVPVAIASAQPPWRPLSRGRYEIGFRAALLLDSSRLRGADNSARPIQMAVWYPAVATAVHPRMTYGRYLALAASETTARAPGEASLRDPVEALTTLLVKNGASGREVSAWMRAPMLAVENARPRARRFPLVVIAQGNGESAADQAVLAEFIASRGYVVATCPSPTRITGPLADDGQTGASAHEQGLDLSFLVDAAGRATNVDVDRVGVIGHSFGARAGLLLAAQRPSIEALVSLDGGIGTANQAAFLAGGFDSAAVRAPILHIYEALDTFMTPDWTLLRSLHSTHVWIAQSTAMHHHHFTSLGGLGAGFPALLAATGGTSNTTREFSEMATLVGEFLDAAVSVTAGEFERWTMAASKRPSLAVHELPP